MAAQNNNDMVKRVQVTAIATDPIYIGTGGYTIGRVDNTIVRDPISRLPKIPGSSLAGTWRYYMALELQNYIKDNYRDYYNDRHPKIQKLKIEDILDGKSENIPSWVKWSENKYTRIQCAGQDDVPHLEFSSLGVDEKDKKTGHCGRCIVCKSFGFSKRDISWQGMLFFSDLEILLFPVFTRLGTRWITTKELIGAGNAPTNKENILTSDGNEQILNLGWLTLKVEGQHNLNNFTYFGIKSANIILVHEDLFSQIVNSNLEVRTSVSIDPLTGAAKEGALFTSEAIPRGTVFTGEIRIFEKDAFKGIDNKIGDLPSADCIVDALCDSKHYYETLGIGGMTTRGFGRLKIKLTFDFGKKECKTSETEENQTSQPQAEQPQNQ